MATIFNSVATVLAAVGQDLGVTDYITIDQKRIDTFADATGDHQWIHVDPVKAKDGPFGATVAHGYLTLSLLAGFFDRALKVKNVRMGINYGLNKVRFMGPVPSGSRLRVRIALLGSEPIERGLQMAWKCTIEREGEAKPVCVAESLSRSYT